MQETPPVWWSKGFLSLTLFAVACLKSVSFGILSIIDIVGKGTYYGVGGGGGAGFGGSLIIHYLFNWMFTN